MSQQQTVTINGMRYDAHSGLPVAQAPVHHATTARPSATTARGVHSAQQRSTTLNRAFVKKSTRIHVADMVKKPQVKRSPHISKFAKDPQAIVTHKKAHQAVQDIAPAKHHAVQKAHHAAHAKTQQHQPKPAHEIKHTAITKALDNAKPLSVKAHKPKKNHSRILNVASASLALLLLAGYFTYINMPNLSVRIAAAQAGIAATYPEYRPTGYRLNGPVAYQDGQVSMNFAANAGPQAFSLNQTKSSWDSSALLANYVEPKSEGSYATYNDGGLTIYTYGSSAAWVNNGILHTLEGSAPLSNDQVRHIATSM